MPDRIAQRFDIDDLIQVSDEFYYILNQAIEQRVSECIENYALACDTDIDEDKVSYSTSVYVEVIIKIS